LRLIDVPFSFSFFLFKKKKEKKKKKKRKKKEDGVSSLTGGTPSISC
jgi:hypothetical protein